MSTEAPPNPELLQKMDMSLDQIIQTGKSDAKPQRKRNNRQRNTTNNPQDPTQPASQPVRGRPKTRGARPGEGQSRLTNFRNGRGRGGRGGGQSRPRGMSPLRPKSEQSQFVPRGGAANRRAQVDQMRGVEYSDESKQQMVMDGAPKPSYFQKRQGSFHIESSVQSASRFSSRPVQSAPSSSQKTLNERFSNIERSNSNHTSQAPVPGQQKLVMPWEVEPTTFTANAARGRGFARDLNRGRGGRGRGRGGRGRGGRGRGVGTQGGEIMQTE